jgi:hypothetical protein
MKMQNKIFELLRMGLEPTTFCSEDRCSTIEPTQLFFLLPT